ncbi:MAG: sugar phosphate nucleotidyltransferase [Firmicutes bacterium]|nr:sugar phosphate nucleotidyltransferase [[Eubacterium] siraeum]MCM1487826.1 sugar phosphate nucleotidyltransferase [Bacillota bacterium]
MKAIIMAGGEGSRLRPLTSSLPKPMVKLCGRPVSEYILDLLSKYGCTEAVFTLRYHGAQIENHFDSCIYKGIALDFSYEDSPLGTAGCVKKAAEKFKEDFLVISGDALCDFNLREAMEYHIGKGAEATILTKRVDDPREYGCVISKDGLVTGFSEKPSFTGAVSDSVNTGIYFLSPKILEMIPENTMWDFSRDLFPQMLKEGKRLAAFEAEGYWCDIGDLSSYKKCQQDMLYGEVKCDIQHKDSHSARFQGSAEIHQPCYIGENVKIGVGTAVEAGAVIGDNVTVGKNCKLRDCVILDGAFLSDKVKVSGGIVCENTVLKQGSAVYEDAVLGAESILGKDSSLEPSVKIWNNKTIPDETVQRENLKYGKKPSKELSERGISGETNADITPAFMTTLGGGVCAVFGDRVIAGCGSGNAASVLKACFCAGFSGAGGKVIDCGAASLPALIHLTRMMNAKGLVHIEASSKSSITVLNKGGLPLTRVQERKLEAAMNRGDYPNAEWDGFGEIKSFKNAPLLYGSALDSASDFSCRYNVKISCTNPLITAAAAVPLRKIGNRKGEELTVRIDHSGTRSELFVSDKEKTDYAKTVLIVARDGMEKGFDAAVPIEFPSTAEEAAKNTGRSVKRFYSCSNDNGDREARELAAKQPYLFDGLLLALNALEIISASYMSLGQYLETIPELATENRFLQINRPPQRIISRLAAAGGTAEGVYLGEAGNRVLLRSNRRGDGLFLFAESYSQETAKALCDEVEKRVKELLEE